MTGRAEAKPHDTSGTNGRQLAKTIVAFLAGHGVRRLAGASEQAAGRSRAGRAVVLSAGAAGALREVTQCSLLLVSDGRDRSLACKG
jgi:hypothetical protein